MHGSNGIMRFLELVHDGDHKNTFEMNDTPDGTEAPVRRAAWIPVVCCAGWYLDEVGMYSVDHGWTQQQTTAIRVALLGACFTVHVLDSPADVEAAWREAGGGG